MNSVVDLSQFASKNSEDPSDAGVGDSADVSAAGSSSSRVVHAPLIVELDKSTLHEVLDVSQQLPVFAVFHSMREPNSATLVDIFSRLARSSHGRFQVATINVDHEPDVAAAFGAQVVPMAVALLQGQPIPLFQGCPDEQTISQALEQVLHAAQQYGLSAVLDTAGEEPEQPSMPPLHQKGFDALEAGDLEKAHEAFTQALRESPADDVAKSALHQVELNQRVKLLGADISAEIANTILSAADQASQSAVDEQMNAADVECFSGSYSAAFSRLIALISFTEGEEREQARRRLLDLFDVVGAQSDDVKKARRRLANVLF